MKALITGATGFVGSHLTRALIRRGDSVRILARTPERARALEAAGAEVRVGDLGQNRAAYKASPRASRSHFTLVRSAMGASAEKIYEQVDVQGTEQLLAEAERAGVRRIVYVGTLAGYPLSRQSAGAVIDERVPFDDTGLLGIYPRAKARAEDLVLAANKRGAIESVIVRLGLVCGTGASVLPAQVCQPLARDRVVLFGDGSVPLPLTYIDNAVDALILAASAQGVAGESFNIVDDDVLTQREYLTLLRQVAAGGRPRSPAPANPFLLHAGSRVGDRRRCA